MKFPIKNRFTAEVIFEAEIAPSFESKSYSIQLGAAVKKAVKARADLTDANLADANLVGADNLIPQATDEQSIENLDKVREIILDDQKRLNMGHWHGSEEWVDRSCAEEAVCGTTHCMAGWLQVCATNPDVRKLAPHIAGAIQAPIAYSMFYKDNADALKWLTDRQYVQDIAARNERRAAKAKTA